LKEFLSRKGIPYLEHDVTKDSLAGQEVMKLTGQNAVPVTVIDGQVVVGFDELRIEQLLIQTQGAASPKFGAAIADVGKVGKKEVPITFGAYVGRVIPSSIAERAGLSVGDIIIQMNKQPISNAADLGNVIAGIKQGDTLSLVFIRGTSVVTAETNA
jgi:S1-C subfamily serine protease